MKKQFLISSLIFAFIACKNSSKTEDTIKETEEITEECWMGAKKANCELVKSYETAKSLALEFKIAKIGSDFSFEKAIKYNDSIFSLVKPLEQDLLKIKEIIGENNYDLYFGNFVKYQEKNQLYKKKLAVISNIKWQVKLLNYNHRRGDRDIQVSLENNNNNIGIELFTLKTSLFDQNDKKIFYTENDGVGAFGFVPNPKRDFIPANYKGKKEVPILFVEDEILLKKAARVEQEIVDVTFKSFE
ncbi:hypothetical protein [Aureivirga marina]|uniref:hypothetical protein n=1 Tax=Aureivirga marina TaxID=1182451 RepID=UPI0018C903BF|nr:hypothetical protein [Aureivirga marina]